MAKHPITSLLLAGLLGLPLVMEGWEEPRTKGKIAFLLEVGPGFLYKGPTSTQSVLYQVDNNGNLTDPFGGTRKTGWQVGVGMRASAMVLANNKEAAEFLYTGLFNWTPFKSVTNTSTGVGILTSPYTTNDWQGASTINWSTRTKYNSYEILMWFFVTPRYENYFSLAVNFGGRFINITDRDHFTSFLAPETTPSQLTVETNNWLRGGEVGLEFNVRPLSYFSWGVIGKGAGFADSITRSLYLTDYSNTVVVANNNDVASKTTGSYLAEVLPYITFQNGAFSAKLIGDLVYIGDISTTASTFYKIRSINQIQTKKKFELGGAFLDLGWIF